MPAVDSIAPNYEYRQATFTWSRNDPVFKSTLQWPCLTIAPIEPTYVNLEHGTIAKVTQTSHGAELAMNVCVGFAPHHNVASGYCPFETTIENGKMNVLATFFVTESLIPREFGCRSQDCRHSALQIPDDVDEVTVVLRKPLIMALVQAVL